MLPTLAARYPQLAIELLLVERYVDLIDEGFDVAIRLGPLPDSSLAGRRLARGRYVLCAAPSYLAQCTPPRTLADIGRHPALVFSTSARRARWPFRWRGRAHTVTPRAAVVSNDAGLLRAAALAGAGVTALPTYLIGADLAAGALVELLPRARMPAWEVYALYASRRHLAARVRAFVDFVAAEPGQP